MGGLVFSDSHSVWGHSWNCLAEVTFPADQSQTSIYLLGSLTVWKEKELAATSGKGAIEQTKGCVTNSSFYLLEDESVFSVATGSPHLLCAWKIRGYPASGNH